MLNPVLDLLFPRRSLRGVPGSLVTEEELRAMRPVPILLDTAELRGRGAAHLDMLAAGCMLDASPLVRMALHRFKYRRVRPLGAVLGEYLSASIPLLATDDAVLCPVPLHWTRYCARGFNQSDDLARRCAANTNHPVEALLRRRMPTGTQTKRTREERLRAMRDVFTAKKDAMPAHVILVDDVATTLATLDACAGELKRAGAVRVDALVVALG